MQSERNFSAIVDGSISRIEEVTRHVQDGHKYFASWCGECKRRRALAFFEISLIFTLLLGAIAYRLVR